MQRTVILACSGLGHVRRGFETFTAELYRALKNTNRHPVILKGAYDVGPFSPYFFRTKALTKICARFLRTTPYTIEQASFALSLLPTLFRTAPNILFLSDGVSLNVLWHLRRYFNFDTLLVLSNGAPFDPPYARCDFVHHTSPDTWHHAESRGNIAKRHFYISHGFFLPNCIPHRKEKDEAKKLLGFSLETKIILSVGALGDTHKRHRAVIEETASLRNPLIRLVLVGQPESGYQELIEFGSQCLGNQFVCVPGVMPEKLVSYYTAADLFVLGSLREGFGRVVVEALAHGLPVIVHDSENFRELYGNHPDYCDLSSSGNLAKCIRESFQNGSDSSDDQRTQRSYLVNQRFSWDCLAKRYDDMFDAITTFKPILTDRDFRRDICQE